MVEILMNDTELRQTLIENYLKRVPDLQKIEWRFIKKKANLQVFKISNWFVLRQIM
jgi:DNA mismatch repair ATPase MutS